jgi:hypothetical protein
MILDDKQLEKLIKLGLFLQKIENLTLVEKDKISNNLDFVKFANLVKIFYKAYNFFHFKITI